MTFAVCLEKEYRGVEGTPEALARACESVVYALPSCLAQPAYLADIAKGEV